MKLVLGDEVETVKRIPMGAEADITLTHYLKNPLSNDLLGFLLEPLNSSGLRIFVLPKSMNRFHLNSPHSSYIFFFLLRLALGVFQWCERITREQ